MKTNPTKMRRKAFLYKTVLEIIFTIKMLLKILLEWFLLYEYIENDFHDENALKMTITIKMHWKWFHYKTASGILAIKMCGNNSQ